MNPFVSFSVVIGLALLHAFAGKLPINRIPPQYWISTASGAAISYIFLEVFPSLGEIQAKIEESHIAGFLQNHIYILSLFGLIFFLGLDKLAAKLGRSLQMENPYFFWLHIGSFTVSNVILGYLLQDSVRHQNLLECLLLFFSIGLHFLVIDRELHEQHALNYDRLGRWLLVGAIVTGAAIRFSSKVDELMVLMLWSWMSGSVILNVMRVEIEREKESSFGIFALSAFLYGLVLIYGVPK